MQSAKLMQWLPAIIKIAREAGYGIMDYYHQSRDKLNVTQKADKTLLTEADLCAHNIVMSGLQQLTPEIPVISEEGWIAPFCERKQWSEFWLSDPLDGTRGFIEKRDEFTVNIAFINDHHPKLGVMYVPAQDICYYAVQGQGVFKQVGKEQPIEIHTKPLVWRHIKILLGHYLRNPKWSEVFAKIGNCELIRLNSSLKFGWIAEGKGDAYPRYGDTSEWDTAAAQCILEEAGGAVVDLQGEPLAYNTKSSLINPPFVALGDGRQKEIIVKFIKNLRGDNSD